MKDKSKKKSMPEGKMIEHYDEKLYSPDPNDPSSIMMPSTSLLDTWERDILTVGFYRLQNTCSCHTTKEHKDKNCEELIVRIDLNPKFADFIKSLLAEQRKQDAEIIRKTFEQLHGGGNGRRLAIEAENTILNSK